VAVAVVQQGLRVNQRKLGPRSVGGRPKGRKQQLLQAAADLPARSTSGWPLLALLVAVGARAHIAQQQQQRLLQRL
jgi:hypothetical protein